MNLVVSEGLSASFHMVRVYVACGEVQYYDLSIAIRWYRICTRYLLAAN